MPIEFVYDIWNGKEIIGRYNAGHFPLYGRYLVIPTISILKREYNKKYEEIIVPIHFLVSDDGITIKSVRVLDVRRKSARQKAIICGKKTG